MEKLSHITENIIDENVEKLAALFPEVVTEVREPDGTLRHTIDVDALKERVGDVAEGQRERYQFTWPGKREAKQEAYRQIDKCLRPCPEESVDWDTTQNLYIEGDNLDALKLLRNTYAGKVKMIYIDPPYNTGHDFIYDDDFARTKADYDAESGDYDEDGGRLVANPESNGRFHSDWCSMMYPRLLLARDLLSEDGVIFTSIDDCEFTGLRRMLDEVFSSANFIATIVRNTNSSKNQSQFVSVSHEYCVIYARSLSSLKDSLGEAKWGVKKNNVDEYVSKVKQLQKMGLSKEEISEELKELTKYPRFTDFVNYWYFDERGLYQKGDMGGVPNGNLEPIFNPLTGRNDPVPPGGFRFKADTINELIAEKRIHFHTDGSLPRIKRYLSENMMQRPKSIMSDDQRPDSNLLNKEFNTPFDNPKQLAFIRRITSIMPDNALILDFFSGSATTAHAVMQLNAEDGGNRKFIMVQLPEVCDEKSEAAKAGYKNICEIGKERVRRAGRKIASEVEESNRQLKLGEEPKRVPDVGFRVLKIDSSNFEDVSAEPEEYTQQAIVGFADNLKSDRTSDDLIIQVMLKKQIELSAPIEKLDVDGHTVFSVDGGRLVACFDRDVPVEVMTAMAKMEPDYAVMRDASFTGDDAVSNFAEIFKNYSSITEVEVI